MFKDNSEFYSTKMWDIKFNSDKFKVLEEAIESVETKALQDKLSKEQWTSLKLNFIEYTDNEILTLLIELADSKVDIELVRLDEGTNPKRKLIFESNNDTSFSKKKYFEIYDEYNNKNEKMATVSLTFDLINCYYVKYIIL